MAGWFLDEIGELYWCVLLSILFCRAPGLVQEKTFRMIGDTADFAWM